MSNTIKVTKENVSELDIHELALLTPKMTNEQYNALKASIQKNGQLEPIRIYRGKVVDGRHRVKVFKELNIETIKAIHENPNQSIDDIREKIINGWEQRRHQTPTQKAIMAYREYIELKNNGIKISQGSIAEQFGTTRLMLSRAKTLSEMVSKDIMDILFNGGKIDIGDGYKPMLTDSLLTLINYFKKRDEEIVIKTKNNNKSNNFTDDEIALINEKFNELTSLFGSEMLKKLNSMLYQHINS